MNTQPRAIVFFWAQGFRHGWQAAYPAIGSEEDAVTLAETSGYEVLDRRTLPDSAWYGYYREVEAALESPEGVKLTPDFRDGLREEADLRALKRQLRLPLFDLAEDLIPIKFFHAG